jgi:hypothetical protein
MRQLLMECGHISNARDAAGNPVCVICFGDPRALVVTVDPPDLTGRFASCLSCGKNNKPSDLNLAFFQYRGPGSPYATETCKRCGYHLVAHKPGWRCQQFTPVGPHTFDGYYCGCRGWN